MKKRSRCFRQAQAKCRPAGRQTALHQRRLPEMLSSADQALLTEFLCQLDSAKLRQTSENESWSVFSTPLPHP